MQFVFLIGGVILFILIAPIILFIRLGNLAKRVRQLESRLGIKAPEAVPVPGPFQQGLRTTPPPAYVPPQVAAGPELAPASMGPDWSEKFFEWLKEDWLLKLGALLILIGFGWLVTYAFLNNWIGPMGRIALGLVGGVLILVLGFWRIRTYLHQGGVFLVLGSTAILLTIFAARELYGFFTPLTALAVMFLSVAFVAFASVQYNSRNLALASLVLAVVAPLLTNSTDPTYIGLFSYLLVVVLGTLWVAVLRGWRELVTAALVVVTLYSMPHLAGATSADRVILLLFMYVFAAIFFVTHTLGILQRREDTITADLVTASGNGLLLLAWIWYAAPEEWVSLIIAAWMVVFAAGGFSVFRATSRKEPFYIYLGVSIAMLAAATAAELDGALLTIAYTIESAIIPVIAYPVLKNREQSETLALLLIGPAVLSLPSITARAWRDTIFHEHFFVLFILALALFGLGGFFLQLKEGNGLKKSVVGGTGIVLGSLYAYALVWLSLHAVLQNADTAVMIALLIYTIVGLSTYFYGRMNQEQPYRVYGGTLLAFVVGRLLLVDVWQMALTGRIITFFLVGALLMSTAFVGRDRQRVTNN